ncbi:DNA cytosine methyltransferase [Streptomyces sp. NBC_00986]|uniref:DNA cytosine methyltransferase n=1 Tax=Streptomyces sp. NBC_00986 TaxID=2903702 RepID=UPI0038636F8B|nr:DNA cytosine methyltransferase [Streptomyces sp. NBC_00986]
MTLRIGSLFSGYGGLDMGVQAVLGGETVWHCQYDPEDKFQYAARILAHHWPEVPNLGDIRFVHWLRTLLQYGPIDVLTGGFPCTDLSVAGHRLGIALGTRSGLWHYMLRAIAILRPRLVVIENVRGILSTKADRGVEPGSADMDPSSGARYVLRALGAVLGDLAAIGFDAEWAGVRASEVGAPHERFREFILAWPADADGPRLEGRGVQGAVAERLAAAADAASVGPQGRGPAWRGGPGPAYGDLAAADADRSGLAGHGELPDRRDAVRQGVWPDAHGRNTAVADADGDAVRQQSIAERRRGGASLVGGSHAQTAADAARLGRREGRAESAWQLGRSDAAERRGRAAGLDVVADDLVVDWGEYGPAVEQWETILGRPHPRPTNDRGQLAAEFDEWMMGCPEGHLCSVPPVPGMTEANLRNARIKAAGNGVVPLQAAAATQLLLDRVAPEVPLVRQIVEYARRDLGRAA